HARHVVAAELLHRPLHDREVVPFRQLTRCRLFAARLAVLGLRDGGLVRQRPLLVVLRAFVPALTGKEPHESIVSTAPVRVQLRRPRLATNLVRYLDTRSALGRANQVHEFRAQRRSIMPPQRASMRRALHTISERAQVPTNMATTA